MGGRWRGSKPANDIIIQGVLMLVGSDMGVFTGSSGNVTNQGADHRVVIMVNRCGCCSRSKVHRSVDGEKAILLLIEWQSAKYWW